MGADRKEGSIPRREDPEEHRSSQARLAVDAMKSSSQNPERTAQAPQHAQKPASKSPMSPEESRPSYIQSQPPPPQTAYKGPVSKASEVNIELIKTVNHADEVMKKLLQCINEARVIDDEQKKEKTADVPDELKKVVVTMNASIKSLEERVKKLENSGIQPAAAVEHRATEGPMASTVHEIPKKSELNAELDDILALLIQHKASDLHLKVGAPPVVRIEGELIPVGEQSLTPRDTQRLILNMLNPDLIQSLYKRNELDFSYQTGRGRFRVNAFLQKGTVSASFRLVRQEIPSFEQLYLPPSLEKLSEYHNGLFLVTGPAGSGKSTTLASIIDYINKREKRHIVTIEDPIEYVFDDINSIITQREVGIDTESFEKAVKMSLRQDPNVVMIGELRDPETVMQAIMAAETGHLILSTLHTPNTIQALRRLMDFFPPALQESFRASLASTLRGILSQRLIRRKDQEGRVPAVEALFTTSTISSLIRDGNIEEIYEYIKDGMSEGMITFTESLTRLFKAGLISKEDAMYHAEQYTELRLQLASPDSSKVGQEKGGTWWHSQM